MKEELLKQVGKRIGDTSDLPEELRSQVAGSKLDEIEQKIVSTLRDRYDGIANVNELMVGLFRDHQVIEDRKVLVNKLYRMNKAGVVESVPKRKGVYALKDDADS